MFWPSPSFFFLKNAAFSVQYDQFQNVALKEILLPTPFAQPESCHTQNSQRWWDEGRSKQFPLDFRFAILVMQHFCLLFLKVQVSSKNGLFLRAQKQPLDPLQFWNFSQEIPCIRTNFDLNTSDHCNKKLLNKLYKQPHLLVSL